MPDIAPSASNKTAPSARAWRLYLRKGGRAPVVRWLAAGVAFMGINTALLYLFISGLGLSVWVGTLAAGECNTLLRYFVNDRWVFGHRHPTFRRLVQYHVANAGALAVWWGVTNLLNAAGIHYLLAGLLAIACSTGVSFATNFYWVWRGKKDSPRPAVSGVVLLRSDGAALLQLRDDKPGIKDPAIWVVPGGHADPGETPAQAAVREFEEETCYRCSEVRPLAEFSAAELGYTGDYRLVFFWANYDGKQAIECREGQALEFVCRDAVGKLPCRDYLSHVWDLALAARDACQS